MAGEAREKCAVSGVVSLDPEIPASVLMYDALDALQHRGAEATGIATLDESGDLAHVRELGLVRDVYNQEKLLGMPGPLAVGHNRYSTSGGRLSHPQPFKDRGIGFAFAHNGNLPVTDNLETLLASNNIRTNKLNDSEMMGYAIASRIREGKELTKAVELCYPYFRGAFSCVAMHGDQIVAFRDSSGIRPLSMGRSEEAVVVVSETCALTTLGATFERDVQPGEMIVLSRDGSLDSVNVYNGEPSNKLDIFELVYFARHDSMLYDQTIQMIRRKSGNILAHEHPPVTDNAENIVVVPIPDTSVPAAEGYSEALGLLRRQSILKNRYAGRTFILPGNKERKQALKRKHSSIEEDFLDKDVILIDDSIVRGNTAPRTVAIAKAAGARTVSVLIASPPVRFPDYYGIDTPSQSELIAANMTNEQIRKEIDCDYLGYLSLSGLIQATGQPADKFTLSCFNGEYPVGIGSANRKQIYTPVSMECVD